MRKTLTVLLLLFPLAASAGAQELCSGRVTDKFPRAMPAMARPGYLTAYADPAFGTTVMRITDADPAEGANAIIKPVYSTIQAWNADESLLVLWHRGVGHELYDGQTYRYLKRLNLRSPSDIESILWDPVYPQYLYYPSSYNASQQIMIHDVVANVSYVWMDLARSGHCTAGDWGGLLGLGSDPSGVSFMTYEPAVGMRCGSTLLNVNLWRKTALKVSAPGTLAPMFAPLGQVAYFGGYAVNLYFNVLTDLGLTNPYDHGSVGTALTAMNAWYHVVFEEQSPSGPASLVRTDLDTGRQKVMVGRSNGWPYPPGGTHISAMSRAIGWVAASAVGNPGSVGQAPLHQEIFLANSDTGEVCRLAHHRSLAGEGPWGYWAEPHVSISPSGTRILFGSDWGGGDAVNTYVIDLR